MGNWVVVLSCDGVSPAEGPEAAIDITHEFRDVRSPRYVNPKCSYADGVLTLSCENDGWDADGENLMDEFSDCLSAYLKQHGENLRLVSATRQKI